MEQTTQQISRWLFEVRREPDGLVRRSVSTQLTEVDGKNIGKGEEIAVSAGTVVWVSNVHCRDRRHSRFRNAVTTISKARPTSGNSCLNPYVTFDDIQLPEGGHISIVPRSYPHHTDPMACAVFPPIDSDVIQFHPVDMDHLIDNVAAGKTLPRA